MTDTPRSPPANTLPGSPGGLQSLIENGVVGESRGPRSPRQLLSTSTGMASTKARRGGGGPCLPLAWQCLGTARAQDEKAVCIYCRVAFVSSRQVRGVGLHGGGLPLLATTPDAKQGTG